MNKIAVSSSRNITFSLESLLSILFFLSLHQLNQYISHYLEIYLDTNIAATSDEESDHKGKGKKDFRKEEEWDKALQQI